MIDRGLALSYASIGVFAFVAFTAWSLAPGSVRPLSLVFATAALVICRQAALRDPSALTWALLASAPPVMALVSGRSTDWLVAPLAALLLLAGELNALGWDLRGASDSQALSRSRLIDSARLCLAGLAAAAIVVRIPRAPAVGGTAMILIGAAALAALGWVAFGSNDKGREGADRTDQA